MENAYPILLEYTVINNIFGTTSGYVAFMEEADIREIFDDFSLTVTEGRLPENDHEIVISDSIRTNGGVEYRVGDTIRLTNSNREDAKGNEEDQSCEYMEGEQLTDSGKAAGEYTVVGFMERLMRSQEPYYAPG